MVHVCNITGAINRKESSNKLKVHDFRTFHFHRKDLKIRVHKEITV